MARMTSIGGATSSIIATITSQSIVFTTSVITVTPSPTGTPSTAPVVVLTSTHPTSPASSSSSQAGVVFTSFVTTTSPDESTSSASRPTGSLSSDGGSPPNKATIAALSTAIPTAFLIAIVLGVLFFRRRQRRLRGDQMGRPPSYATYLDGDTRDISGEKMVDEKGAGLLSFFRGKRVSELDPSAEIPRTPNTIPRGHEVQGSPVVSDFTDRAEMGNNDIRPVGGGGTPAAAAEAWPGLASNAPIEVYQPYRRPTPSTEISEERRLVPSPLGSPLVDARGNIIFSPEPFGEDSDGRVTPGTNDRAKDTSAKDNVSVPHTPVAHQEISAPDSHPGQTASQSPSGGHGHEGQVGHGEEGASETDHGIGM